MRPRGVRDGTAQNVYIKLPLINLYRNEAILSNQ